MAPWLPNNADILNSRPFRLARPYCRDARFVVPLANASG